MKEKLTFDQLQDEMEVLGQSTLTSIKGGVEYDIYEFGMNGYGQKFIRLYGTTEWTPMLEEVTIPFISVESMRPEFDYNNYFFLGGENPFGFPGGSGGNGGNPPTPSGNFNTPWPRQFLEGLQNLDPLTNVAGMLAFAGNNPLLADAFGRLSYVAAGVNFSLDARAMADFYRNAQGNMDGVRFTIRQGGTAGVMIEASIVGGPQGLLVGVAGAAVVVGLEMSYDALQEWMRQCAQGLSDYENALANGYNPAIH